MIHEQWPQEFYFSTLRRNFAEFHFLFKDLDHRLSIVGFFKII